MGYYDDIAKGYDELHGEEQLQKLRMIHDYLVEKGFLTDTVRILDVGCGTGLSAQVFDQRILGVEPSEGLAKQAPFDVTIGPGEEMPFTDNTFDIVLCVTALHNFDDPEQGVKEMKRVTKSIAAITLLKKANNIDELKGYLRQEFMVLDILDEEKDQIFMLKKV